MASQKMNLRISPPTVIYTTRGRTTERANIKLFMGNTSGN